jgi:hypothetical protein
MDPTSHHLHIGQLSMRREVSEFSSAFGQVTLLRRSERFVCVQEGAWQNGSYHWLLGALESGTAAIVRWLEMSERSWISN